MTSHNKTDDKGDNHNPAAISLALEGQRAAVAAFYLASNDERDEDYCFGEPTGVFFRENEKIWINAPILREQQCCYRYPNQ